MRRSWFGLALLAGFGAASAANASWIAGAAGFWHDTKGGSHVGVGYAIDSTAAAAVAGAVEQCKSSGPGDCEVLGPYNSGCLYISVGHSRNGTVWGSGPTEDGALAKCEDEGGTCKAPIGGCVGG